MYKCMYVLYIISLLIVFFIIFTRYNPSKENMKNKINNYFDNGGDSIIIKTKQNLILLLNNQRN